MPRPVVGARSCGFAERAGADGVSESANMLRVGVRRVSRRTFECGKVIGNLQRDAKMMFSIGEGMPVSATR